MIVVILSDQQCSSCNEMCVGIDTVVVRVHVLLPFLLLLLLRHSLLESLLSHENSLELRRCVAVRARSADGCRLALL